MRAATSASSAVSPPSTASKKCCSWRSSRSNRMKDLPNRGIQPERSQTRKERSMTDVPDVLLFKRGSDQPQIDDEDTVTCLVCGTIQSDQAALEHTWQLVPPVCPDCLRWQL